ncbi:MAG: DUF2970 domain-containing protein [Pseudomonadota bacterium]|nr:DUF2970 domain-containing protein [Pseudomonadota bacterium]
MKLPESDLRAAASRKGSFLQTMKAVAWSFFGVRKSSDYAKDLSQLNPVHIVIAGVLGALVLIAVLATVVSWVLSSGVAA